MGTCQNCKKPLIPYKGKCQYCGAEVNAPVNTRWYADFVFCIDCGPSTVGFYDIIIFDNPIVFDSGFISSSDELLIPKSEIKQFHNSDEFYYHKPISDFGKALNRHISYFLDSKFDEDDIL